MPACTINEAAAPIIAALSVHKFKGGTYSGIFSFLNASSSEVRNPLFADTPPAAITYLTFYSRAARTVFAVNTSTTLSWNPFATCSGIISSPR